MGVTDLGAKWVLGREVEFYRLTRRLTSWSKPRRRHSEATLLKLVVSGSSDRGVASRLDDSHVARPVAAFSH